MAGVKAIAVTYSGVRFRSTLEGDWATNLDRLHLRWQYEPEGLVLPGGAGYRCDFYLPRLDTYLEVKGPHNQRIGKPGLLAGATHHAPGCAKGSPAEVNDIVVPADPCPCGFGPAFPWRLVVVGRPATNGKMTFHGAPSRAHPSPAINLARCPQCRQFSFVDVTGLWGCRRCRSVSDPDQVPTWPTGEVDFTRLEPPTGRRRKPSSGRSSARRTPKRA